MQPRRLARRAVLGVWAGALVVACGPGQPQPGAPSGSAPAPKPTADGAPPLPAASPAAAPSPAVAAPAASPSPSPAAAGSPTYPKTDLLIDVAGLAGRLSDPAVRLIELSDAAEYARGHLPGAVNLQWPELELKDSSEATIESWRQDMEKKLGERGIRTSDQVVLYDDGSLWAARPWWILEFLNHHYNRTLNGGKAAWLAAGNQPSTEQPAVTQTMYVGRPDRSVLVTADDVRSKLGLPDVVIVDARRPEEYRGDDNSGAKRAGHIPGAVNIPYTQTAEEQPPRFFKPADQLRRLYSERGVTPDKEVIAYCTTGVRSAVTYFSLMLLGYPKLRLYSASWAEWGNRDDLPIERQRV